MRGSVVRQVRSPRFMALAKGSDHASFLTPRPYNRSQPHSPTQQQSNNHELLPTGTFLRFEAGA